MAGGRPTKLTPELTTQLLALLREGKPMAPCCEVVGIDDSTFRLWRSKAKQGDQALSEFFAEVARARAEGELVLWDIAKVADEEGRGRQWLLERTHGKLGRRARRGRHGQSCQWFEF